MAYAQALQALGDPTRRSVLEELRDGPEAVGEIASRLPVSRPAVSQHLRVLKEAGLVTERQDGTRRLSRVDPDGLAGLREYLDGFWEEALASFKAAAGAEERREKRRPWQRQKRSPRRSTSTRRPRPRSRCSPSGSESGGRWSNSASSRARRPSPSR